MSLDSALEKAIREMAEVSPYVAAAKSGADFDGSKFKLEFFNRTFLIHYPEVRIEELGEQRSLPEWLPVTLLHYLLTADGSPVADRWITYRHLPGGHLGTIRFSTIFIVSPLSPNR